jgi:hypothetical protein
MRKWKKKLRKHEKATVISMTGQGNHFPPLAHMPSIL